MRAWPCILLSALVACSSATEPPRDPSPDVRQHPDGTVEERRIGVIEHYGDPVHVEAPVSVASGESFSVRVRTYGGGCVRKSDTEAHTDGLTARVTPYDWEVVRLPPNGACTEELRIFEHSATLRFDQPGTARIVVRGRSKPSGQVLTVERDVVVR